MLKLTHVQARLVVSNGQASVRQMNAKLPEDYKRAEDVIRIFRLAAEKQASRDALDAQLAEYTGTRLDYREIDGLAKVISDTYADFQPLGFAPSVADEDEEATENARLSAFRLAVWRTAARPQFYPFAQASLTATIAPGVQNLRRAAATHDEDLLANLISQSSQDSILQTAATECGLTLDELPGVGQVGDLLFSDLAARHRLISVDAGLDVATLINRYNVELLRGVLYLSPRLKITVRDKYKDLFKYIKFFGLMHEVRPLDAKGQPSTEENAIAGYEMILEGASSPFLARTDRRYGIKFAQFLPALLLCEDEWQLETELVLRADETSRGGGRAFFKLGPQPHLQTHFRGSGEFDSTLEESLAAAFEERFKTTSRSVATPETDEPASIEGDDKPKKRKKAKPKPEGREGWTITREDRIVPVFDTVMIPDFAFEHTDGRRALLEVVGFWERGYLERKIAKLNRAGRTDIIVLVSERTRCGPQDFKVEGQAPPYQLIFFKGTPRLGPIMEALEKCAR